MKITKLINMIEILNQSIISWRVMNFYIYIYIYIKKLKYIIYLIKYDQFIFYILKLNLLSW